MNFKGFFNKFFIRKWHHEWESLVPKMTTYDNEDFHALGFWKKNIIIIIRHSEKAKEAAKKTLTWSLCNLSLLQKLRALEQQSHLWSSLHPLLLLYIHASWGPKREPSQRFEARGFKNYSMLGFSLHCKLLI